MVIVTGMVKGKQEGLKLNGTSAGGVSDWHGKGKNRRV